MRILRIVPVVLTAAAAFLCPAQERRKNVLMLIADDQGRDLGCYGNAVIQTPNLDRLAAEGVRFTHGFATVASCSASRSVILTGLYNHSNGQFGHAHDPANLHTHGWVWSAPRVLKAQGYATGVIGKLHVNPESVYPWDFHTDPPSGGGGTRDVSLMARRAAEFFAKFAGQPFYLHVGFGDPHRAGRGFGNERAYPGIQKISYAPAKVIVPAHLPDRPEVRQEIAEHYEAVSRLDQGVGLILKALKDAGLERDTLVLYVSDNGIPFAGAKTTLYDAGVRLPLLVRSPDQKRRGVVNQAMVSWVDLVPTILEWTGAKTPAGYQLPGRSFLPILEQESPAGWDQVFLSHTFHEITMYYPTRGIRTRRYKYLWNLTPELEFPHASDLYESPTWQGIRRRKDSVMGVRSVAAYLRRPAEELYDLEADPNEVRNLASDPEHRRALDDLRRRVQEFRVRTQDPWNMLSHQKGEAWAAGRDGHQHH